MARQALVSLESPIQARIALVSAVTIRAQKVTTDADVAPRECGNRAVGSAPAIGHYEVGQAGQTIGVRNAGSAPVSTAPA